jgi:hypothetical protein
MNIRMLAAFNIAASDDALFERIDFLADEWQSGVIEPATFDGDTIASLRLTAIGVSYGPFRCRRRRPKIK